MILVAFGMILGFVGVVFVGIAALEVSAGVMMRPKAGDDSVTNGIWTGIFGVVLIVACIACLVHSCSH